MTGGGSSIPAVQRLLRVLAAGNARIFRLGLSNGTPLMLIGGDAGLLEAPIELPSIGLVASTAVEFVGEETDTRVTTLPNVAVATSAADFFGGRDPVLAAALR